MTRRTSVLVLATIATAFFSPSNSFAAPCLEWSLGEKNGDTFLIRFVQDNQWRGSFWLVRNGTVLSGNAEAYRPDDRSSGIVQGTLKGSTLQLRVHWDTRNTVGMYKGTIDENGVITGATWDKSKPNAQVRWQSNDSTQSTCISYADEPATKQPDPISETSKKGIDLTDGVLLPGKEPAPDPTPPPPQMATANRDTDIYSGPDGGYDRLGFIKKGDKVQVLGQQNGWTKIKYYYPPTNNAVWVWGEHLT